MKRRSADCTRPWAPGGAATKFFWAPGVFLLLGFVCGASAEVPAASPDTYFAGPVQVAVVGKESRSIEQL